MQSLFSVCVCVCVCVHVSMHVCVCVCVCVCVHTHAHTLASMSVCDRETDQPEGPSCFKSTTLLKFD